MLWRCVDCTTGYAVGLAACPHCGSTRKEDEMPKITRHEGPSYAPVEAPEVPVEAPEEPAEAPVEEKPTTRTPAKRPSSRASRKPR